MPPNWVDLVSGGGILSGTGTVRKKRTRVESISWAELGAETCGFARCFRCFRSTALRMTTENEFTSRLPGGIHNSMSGKIYIPLIAATLPAGLFTLLGFITKGLDRPGIEPPVWVIVSMIAVQTLGMISMAFVILVRFDLGSRTLMVFTKGQPHVWRKCTLTLSIACLLMFDILTSVSAAFAGAGFLLVGAVPVFIAYVVCSRIAFVGLGPSWPRQ